jgi:hypothetical protein
MTQPQLVGSAAFRQHVDDAGQLGQHAQRERDELYALVIRHGVVPIIGGAGSQL